MPLHQYFWSITVKVRWCSFAPGLLVCGYWRNIWRCKTQKNNKEKEKMHTEKNTCTVSTPACMQSFLIQEMFVPLFHTTTKHVMQHHPSVSIQLGRGGRMKPTTFFQLWKWNPGTQRQCAAMITTFCCSGVKSKPGCSHAIKTYSPKFPFNKESENENIIFSQADGNCCFLTAGI